MGVQLIDPIEAIKEFSFANGVPEYEQMFIFAELTAQRRGRSIILSSGNGNFSLERTINTDLVVNMLGPDRPTSTFTTNWSEATSATKDVYEGFGITKIHVKINSSFVPVVTIDFVDIRGLAFFNSGKNSPYSVLHDFPPPMFDLTLKGYYGKSLTYQLHLVRQNTSFEGETGNYNTTAEFVARTFAPLTDVLFQYPRMFPLIDTDTVDIPSPQANAQPVGNLSTSDRSVQPKNTFDFLNKIENTYQQIDRLLEDSDEKELLETKRRESRDVKTILEEVGSFAKQLKDTDNPYNSDNTTLLTRQIDNEDQLTMSDKSGDTLKTIDSINDYQRQLKISETSSIDLNNQVFLGINLYVEDVGPFVVNKGPLPTTNESDGINTLNNYRKILISKFPKKAVSDTFDKYTSASPESDLNNIIPRATTATIKEYLGNLSKTNSDHRLHHYAVLDITNFYQKMYKYLVVELDKEINTLQTQLGDRVNNLIFSNLEMWPTIKNVFEVICNDVDIFFNKLRDTSVKAQEHHNEPANKGLITGKDDLPEEKNKKTQIDAFPLYIEQSTINSSNTRGLSDNQKKNCKSVTRKQRAYPAKKGGISNQTTTQFPEVQLVEDFINVYIKLRNLELINKIREQQNSDGNLVFIPSTPYDSKIGNDAAYQSPYVASSVEGAIGTEGLNAEQIFNILLNRFYVFSQYTYGESFYKSDKEENRNSLARFGGQSEANNIAISLINQETIDNLLTLLANYDTAEELFQYFEDNNITNYSATEEGKNGRTFIQYGKGGAAFDPIYKDKSNSDYIGLTVIDTTSSNRNNGQERSPSEGNSVDSYITKFNEDNDANWFLNLFGVKDQTLSFSKENVQIIKDASDLGNNETKFIFKSKDFANRDEDEDFVVDVVNKLAVIFNGASALNGQNFLSNVELYNFLSDPSINEGSKLFLITSMFSFSKSLLTTEINNLMDVPAIINAPMFFSIYSGALLDYEAEFKSDLQPLFDKFYAAFGKAPEDAGGQTVFTRNYVKSVDSTQIDRDLENVNILSDNDKTELRSLYKKFFTNDKNILITLLIDLTTLLKESIDDENDGVLWTEDTYIERIKADTSLTKILQTQKVVNYSELTLTQDEITEDNLGVDPTVFVPLSITTTDENLNAVNQVFFNSLINKLKDELKKRKETLINTKTELTSSLNDTDIKNQCYYSFKSISDKWLAGFGNNTNGFPFNKDGKSLIDSFIFVDRAFNDIGDKVVINLKPLLEYENDYDSSVFSVLSRILALNGFEFFPLQNFMSFAAQDWKDSFKIWETLEQETAPAFVCMYVGGVSSKLKSFTGDDVFDDDGISDLGNQEDVPDFWSDNDCDGKPDPVPSTDNNVEREQDRERNKPTAADDLQFNNVKAFRVRFGEQDQAVFKNIKLDTREFKDTNESLAILSEIAQDESYATPIPKGQNLFNTFEQRSYSATIDMLGDMMIQPTQYFQLENIPLFSGAYLVLSVEHEFTANHASTSFTGVRILKYPVPYVVDPASFSGLKSSASLIDNPASRKEISRNAEAYIGMNQLSIKAKEE